MVRMTQVLTDPSLDREAVARQYMQNMRAMDPAMVNDPLFQTWSSLLAGDLESAAQTAAGGRLSEPWSMNTDVFRIYQRPWYRQLIEFPEVKEQLISLERQRQEQRVLTLDMLAELVDQ